MCVCVCVCACMCVTYLVDEAEAERTCLLTAEYCLHSAAG